MCEVLSTLKYCQCHGGHLFAFRKTAVKALKQGVKVVQTYKYTTTIDSRFASVFFINREHRSHFSVTIQTLEM